MVDARFITPAMSVALDAVRFSCALIVVICHSLSPPLFAAGPWPLNVQMAHHSVVVFFVLSGLVISATAVRRHGTLADFVIARFSRITLVAYPSIVFSLAAYLWFRSASGPLPQELVSSLASSVVSGVLFLSESPSGTPMFVNSTFWSLCYEVWYYVLFGLFFYLRGLMRWVCVSIAAVIAGPAILIMMPVWLAGVWLNHSKWARSVPAEKSVIILIGCAAGMLALIHVDFALLFWLRGLVPFSLGMSEWILSDLILSVIVVAALAALRPLAERHGDFLEKISSPVTYAAGFSFTLYLFHPYLLKIIAESGFSAGTNPIAYALIIAVVLAVSAGIAALTEQRTPVFRRWLTRLFTSSDARPSLAR